jgi:hypothetical protein
LIFVVPRYPGNGFSARLAGRKADIITAREYVLNGASAVMPGGPIPP